MKKTILLLIIALSVFSCKKEKNIPESFDYGTVESNAYFNDFFNFKLNFPEGWHVLDQNEQNRLMDQSIDLIDNAKGREMLDASLINVANLFTAFKKPVGSNTTEFNPSILINAENLKDFPEKDPSTSDYMIKAKEFMDQTGMNYKIISPETAITIGGQDFVTMELDNEILGNTITQTHYLTIKNGFAINIFISYINDEDKKLLKEIINSMRFK